MVCSRGRDARVDADADASRLNCAVKNYVRLARVQHFLKQYHKAVETFKMGLKLDPKNQELLDGLRCASVHYKCELILRCLDDAA